MSREFVGWFELGTLDYESAYLLQLRLSQMVKERQNPGFLLFLQHPPTITLGLSLKGDEGKSELRVSPEYLVEHGIQFFHADRGGKATFHGPGQLVAYPILNLNRFHLSSKKYVNKLEDTVIQWLGKMGIEASRDLDYPGVWVSGRKIASVGVRIQDRVSRHGIAVNICPDLSFFELIAPCGMLERKMTSYLEVTGKNIDLKKAASGLAAEFASVFDAELKPCDPNMLSLEGGLDDNQRMAYAGPV